MHIRRSPINDRKIRFALAGCGRIAQNHFEAIKRHSARCELTDICDDNHAALQTAASAAGPQPTPASGICWQRARLTAWFWRPRAGCTPCKR